MFALVVRDPEHRRRAVPHLRSLRRERTNAASGQHMVSTSGQCVEQRAFANPRVPQEANSDAIWQLQKPLHASVVVFERRQSLRRVLLKERLRRLVEPLQQVGLIHSFFLPATIRHWPCDHTRRLCASAAGSQGRVHPAFIANPSCNCWRTSDRSEAGATTATWPLWRRTSIASSVSCTYGSCNS